MGGAKTRFGKQQKDVGRVFGNYAVYVNGKLYGTVRYKRDADLLRDEFKRRGMRVRVSKI